MRMRLDTMNECYAVLMMEEYSYTLLSCFIVIDALMGEGGITSPDSEARPPFFRRKEESRRGGEGWPPEGGLLDPESSEGGRGIQLIDLLGSGS